MRNFIISIILLFVSTLTIAQPRLTKKDKEPPPPVIISKSVKLINATGWFYFAEDDKWYSNKNTIQKFICENDSGCSKEEKCIALQSFEWVQLWKIFYSGDTIYTMLSYRYYPKDYEKFISGKDNSVYPVIDFALFKHKEFEKISKRCLKNDAEYHAIDCLWQYSVDNKAATVGNDIEILEKEIIEAVEKFGQINKPDSYFTVDLQKNPDTQKLDLVRFTLPGSSAIKDNFDILYFELPRKNFEKFIDFTP
jgi:hypothetical protein